jgi:hypothetical protein
MNPVLSAWSGTITGIALLVAGTLGFRYLPKEFWHNLSEALVISGVLTLAVDPFVKRRLLKEVSRDIFHHLLGVDLPIDIRDTLSGQLTQTDSYREDAHIEVAVQTSGIDALVTISQRGKVVALKTFTYQQGIMFEESEHGKVLEASVTGNRDHSQDYSKKDIALTEKPDELMVWQWFGPKISLQRGEKITSSVKYQVTRSKCDFIVINFGAPFVKPTLSLSASPDLDINASIPDRRNGDQYIYEKVFLTSDHLQIRWKPTASAPATGMGTSGKNPTPPAAK